MSIKQPTTYQEQVEILRGRGCFILDDAAGIDFLRRVNYYRFSGYLHAFKQNDGTYADVVSFEKIASMYTFDKDLRALLMRAVSEIELFAKSIIAYHHGHHYGSLGYLDASSFNTKHNHAKFIEQFETVVRNNRNSPIARHHIRNYGGSFPIWVATELFTMGMTSFFYADLLTGDKKVIAKEFGTDYVHLESWLHSTSVLRNICAHHGRLFITLFHQPPKLPRKYLQHTGTEDYSLFRQLCMLKLLYANWRIEWNSTIFLPLEALIEKYDSFVDVRMAGFPDNWRDILRWA